MSRNLRWRLAEEYFVRRMGQVRVYYRGFARTHGRCCRCGRKPDGTGRLYTVVDKQRNELLEYGIDCWPKYMLPALANAIERETDQNRKQIMEANAALLNQWNLSEPYWEPDDAVGAEPGQYGDYSDLDTASSLEHNPPEVRLKVSPEEALRKLRTIPNKTCLRVIDHKWSVYDDGLVMPHSVAWLFCWGKTGMGSPKAAAASRRVFNEILDVTFDEYDDLVDHEEARRDRERR